MDGYGKVGNWVMSYFASAQVEFKNESTDYQVVNVVDAGNQSSTEPTYVTWIGRSKNYVDKLIVTLNAYKNWTNSTTNQFNDEMNYIGAIGSANCYFIKWGNINGGYYANLSESADTIWKPSPYWTNSSSAYNGWQSNPQGFTVKTASTSVEIKPVVENNESYYYDYEHIVTYGNLTEYQVCDPDWLNSLRANGSTIGTNLLNSERSGNWGGTEEKSASDSSSGGTRAQTSLNGYYKGNYGTDTNTTNLPTVGRLSKTYTSNTIYQSETTFLQTVDKTDFTSDKIFLTKGFQLLAAKDGDTIEWTPVFINNKYDGASSKKNVVLYLSVGPFGNEVTPDTDSELIRDELYYEKYKTERKYFLIQSSSQKIKFVMPKDGIVYAKWHLEDFDNSKKWESTLDLSECDTYLRIKVD